MKRTFIASLVLLSFSFLSKAQVSLGVEAGATYNTLSQHINGVDRATEGQFGFRGGFNVNIPFGETSRFHLQPAVVFDANSGSKSSYSGQSATGAGIPVYETDMRHYRVNQVNVPLYLVYKAGDPVYDEDHFFIGIGPSVSFTVGGRLHQVYSNALNGRERVQDNDLPLNVGTGMYQDFARFNIGGSVMLGYEFGSGLYVKGHYTHNINNMHPLADTKNRMQAAQAGLTVGIFFKKFQRYKY